MVRDTAATPPPHPPPSAHPTTHAPLHTCKPTNLFLSPSPPPSALSLQLVRNSHNLLSNLLNFTVVINDDGILLTFSDLAEMGAAFKVRYEMVGEDKCKMVDYGLVKYRQGEGGEEEVEGEGEGQGDHDELLYHAREGGEEEYEFRKIVEECGNSDRWRPDSDEIIEPHELNQHYERGSKYFSSLASLCRSLSDFSLSHPYTFACHPLVIDDASPPVCDYLIVDVLPQGGAGDCAFAGEDGEEAALKIGIACGEDVRVDTIFRNGKEVEGAVGKDLMIDRILEKVLECTPLSPER